MAESRTARGCEADRRGPGRRTVTVQPAPFFCRHVLPTSGH